MESLLQDIIDLLIRVGPWIVFAVTASETAFFIGLLIPAEATVLVAAFMANAGHFELRHVILATILGGLTGDNLGYLLGRFGGRRMTARGGRIGRMWQRHEPRAAALFEKKSLLSVTAARFISFVRTLMPCFAGMSGMPWPRFFVFDLLGVLGWGLGSIAAGYLAGRSWHVMASALGTASTVIVVALALGIGMVALRARRRRRSLRRVALTGNIASGKSAVADVWRNAGAVIVDADELARRAVEPGTVGLRQVKERFGPSVITDSGELDREAMRELAFSDERKRRELEAIIHPEVERLRQLAEQDAAAAGAAIVVHMIPLLFETGMDDRFDLIVLVDAPVDERRRRLVEHRALTAEQADAMIAAQMPAEQKRKRAHIVVDNDTDRAVLEERAQAAWLEVKARLQ